MLIQWYPGHMTKARRELAAAMPSQDLLLEVLDARLPASSENPVVAQLRGDKPCIKLLCKADLADPTITEDWLHYFASRQSGRGRVLVAALSSSRPAETRARVEELCRQLSSRQPLRAMIVGVPNVGKSTLINTLMNCVVATVGDKPAVTKARQQVVLKSGMVIWDSPGLMWPKIENEAVSLRLAFAGSIPDTAVDCFDAASFGARFLLERYPERLLSRFKLTELPTTAEALIAAIGRRRGSLRSGGAIDLHKAAEALVHEFRSGGLGRISLETPSDHRDIDT